MHISLHEFTSTICTKEPGEALKFPEFQAAVKHPIPVLGTGLAPSARAVYCALVVAEPSLQPCVQLYLVLLTQRINC